MILGLDYGEVRVGLALHDEAAPQSFPRPLKVFVRKGRARDLERLCHLITEHGVTLMVVGVALAPDGGLGQRARQARNFAHELSSLSGVPYALQDERDSSGEAMQRLIDAGVGQRRRADLLDPLAACIILERYAAEHPALSQPAPVNEAL